MKIENPIFYFIFPQESDRKFYIQNMLAAILTSGTNSYLQQLYVQNTNASLSAISAGSNAFQRASFFMIAGQVLNNKSLEEFKEQFDKDMISFCSDQVITNDRLAIIKNQFVRSQYEGYTNSSVAAGVIDAELVYGDFKKAFEGIDIYRSITLEEIKAECLEMFQVGSYQIFAAGNQYEE